MQCETHRDPLENPPKDLTAIGSEKSNMTMLCFKKIFFSPNWPIMIAKFYLQSSNT